MHFLRDEEEWKRSQSPENWAMVLMEARASFVRDVAVFLVTFVFLEFQPVSNHGKKDSWKEIPQVGVQRSS